MIEHPNKDRHFRKGEICDARPTVKSHRLPILQQVIDISNEMHSLVGFFNLSEKEVNDIIKNEFGQGVGYQTTRIFLDKTYGPGFNCRQQTLRKYEYLINFLKKAKKQFAKSAK